MRGSGLGFLAFRFSSGSEFRERIGLGGKGREVCVHVGGLWGWDQAEHSMQSVFCLLGDVGQVLEDRCRCEGWIEGILHLFHGCGQEVLELLVVGGEFDGKGLVSRSGVGNGVGAKEGRAL